MAKTIETPDIGGDSLTINEIMVKVGDSVEVDQPLLSAEGDKASMEVPAPCAGTIKEILVKEGDSISTGTPIFVMDGGEATAEAPQPAAEAASTPAEADAPQAVATPAADEGVSAPAAANTGAAVSSKPAPQKAATPEYASTPRPSSATPGAPAAKASSALSQTEVAARTSFAHATPVVRRLAREFGVDLDKVKPTGPKNRILKQDVQAYVAEAVKLFDAVGGDANALAAKGGSGAALGLLPWPQVDFSKFGEIEKQKLSRIKKISGDNLLRNWVMIPHVNQWDKADITELEAFRKEQNALLAKKDAGIKVTPVAFIMKAVAKAIQEYPLFGSSIDPDGEHIIMKKYINIGVAVDTKNGLVVPVIKDVDKKTITQLSVELAEMGAKARAGKLTSADMQGGCFTISSLGGIGGTHFAPIVNAPEVAILGVSKSSMEPVWNGKEFAPRLMLPLSLSYDHRVIDGADGARFITYLSKVLSDLRYLVM